MRARGDMPRIGPCGAGSVHQRVRVRRRGTGRDRARPVDRGDRSTRVPGGGLARGPTCFGRRVWGSTPVSIPVGPALGSSRAGRHRRRSFPRPPAFADSPWRDRAGPREGTRPAWPAWRSTVRRSFEESRSGERPPTARELEDEARRRAAVAGTGGVVSRRCTSASPRQPWRRTRERDLDLENGRRPWGSADLPAPAAAVRGLRHRARLRRWCSAATGPVTYCSLRRSRRLVTEPRVIPRRARLGKAVPILRACTPSRAADASVPPKKRRFATEPT